MKFKTKARGYARFDVEDGSPLANSTDGSISEETSDKAERNEYISDEASEDHFTDRSDKTESNHDNEKYTSEEERIMARYLAATKNGSVYCTSKETLSWLTSEDAQWAEDELYARKVFEY